MTPTYPPVGFHFTAAIGSYGAGVDASFAEVSGLSTELGVFEINEGGVNTHAHRVPDRGRSGNLVLKRGLVLAASPLFLWCKETLEGGLGRRVQVQDVVVSLLNDRGNPTLSWIVSRAWPVKCSIADFNAMEGRVVTETLELAYATVVQKRTPS
ncbi:phage tail protein [Thiocapsa marina]|uniref:Phage tail protein n=1 Tax=Thiocapsa marina 5811 TaxID=768671 RepID=F9U9L2_9GAMM|nr:phage tail protein [Thiocapsa marina]EGV18810.1 Conserved hypothetical protein CHP02241, phage tail region protein [Thiocapsa marina 5811]